MSPAAFTFVYARAHLVYALSGITGRTTTGRTNPGSTKKVKPRASTRKLASVLAFLRMLIPSPLFSQGQEHRSERSRRGATWKGVSPAVVLSCCVLNAVFALRFGPGALCL